jgi:hypothetical protein
MRSSFSADYYKNVDKPADWNFGWNRREAFMSKPFLKWAGGKYTQLADLFGISRQGNA